MPRPGLTHARVVAEAAIVADEQGLERLTLAAVAHRLGVSLPALYKHVRGVEGLQRDLAVLGVRELTVLLSLAAAGRAGRNALQGVGRAYRQYAAEHPGLSAASVRAPDPSDAEHLAVSEAIVAVLLATLASYGLSDADTVDAIRALRVTMHGFASLEAAGGFGLPQSVDVTYTRLIDALDATFSGWANATS